MPRLKVIEHNGTEHVVDIANGVSIMQAVTGQGIPGIVGECGGQMSCATCHAYIDEKWVPLLEPPSESEKLMIDCAVEVQPNSRLTCQITVESRLDGLVLRLPVSQ